MNTPKDHPQRHNRQNQDAPQSEVANTSLGGAEERRPGEDFYTLPEDQDPKLHHAAPGDLPAREPQQPESMLDRETHGQLLDIKESDADRNIHPEDASGGGLAQSSSLHDNNDRDTYAQ
jgi:hypothetical protein